MSVRYTRSKRTNDPDECDVVGQELLQESRLMANAETQDRSESPPPNPKAAQKRKAPDDPWATLKEAEVRQSRKVRRQQAKGSEKFQGDKENRCGPQQKTPQKPEGSGSGTGGEQDALDGPASTQADDPNQGNEADPEEHNGGENTRVLLGKKRTRIADRGKHFVVCVASSGDVISVPAGEQLRAMDGRRLRCNSPFSYTPPSNPNDPQPKTVFGRVLLVRYGDENVDKCCEGLIAQINDRFPHVIESTIRYVQQAFQHYCYDCTPGLMSLESPSFAKATGPTRPVPESTGSARRNLSADHGGGDPADGSHSTFDPSRSLFSRNSDNQSAATPPATEPTGTVPSEESQEIPDPNLEREESDTPPISPTAAGRRLDEGKSAFKERREFPQRPPSVDASLKRIQERLNAIPATPTQISPIRLRPAVLEDEDPMVKKMLSDLRTVQLSVVKQLSATERTNISSGSSQPASSLSAAAESEATNSSSAPQARPERYTVRPREFHSVGIFAMQSPARTESVNSRNPFQLSDADTNQPAASSSGSEGTRTISLPQLTELDTQKTFSTPPVAMRQTTGASGSSQDVPEGHRSNGTTSCGSRSGVFEAIRMVESSNGSIDPCGDNASGASLPEWTEPRVFPPETEPSPLPTQDDNHMGRIMATQAEDDSAVARKLDYVRGTEGDLGATKPASQGRHARPRGKGEAGLNNEAPRLMVGRSASQGRSPITIISPVMSRKIRERWGKNPTGNEIFYQPNLPQTARRTSLPTTEQRSRISTSTPQPWARPVRSPSLGSISRPPPPSQTLFGGNVRAGRPLQNEQSNPGRDPHRLPTDDSEPGTSGHQTTKRRPRKKTAPPTQLPAQNQSLCDTDPESMLNYRLKKKRKVKAGAHRVKVVSKKIARALHIDDFDTMQMMNGRPVPDWKLQLLGHLQLDAHAVSYISLWFLGASALRDQLQSGDYENSTGAEYTEIYTILHRYRGGLTWGKFMDARRSEVGTRHVMRITAARACNSILRRKREQGLDDSRQSEVSADMSDLVAPFEIPDGNVEDHGPRVVHPRNIARGNRIWNDSDDRSRDTSRSATITSPSDLDTSSDARRLLNEIPEGNDAALFADISSDIDDIYDDSD